jgi:hypothetical protein
VSKGRDRIVFLTPEGKWIALMELLAFYSLCLVGRHSGFYHRAMERNMLLAIKKATPAFLLVGSGLPGRYLWILRHKKELTSGSTSGWTIVSTRSPAGRSPAGRGGATCWACSADSPSGCWPRSRGCSRDDGDLVVLQDPASQAVRSAGMNRRKPIVSVMNPGVSNRMLAARMPPRLMNSWVGKAPPADLSFQLPPRA